MNYNPFETIKNILMNQQMTHDEKRHMKMALVSYVSTHPVKSGLVSPYTFRYATLALASLVIVLGGSIGLTSASQQALPTGKLYPIKLWIEEYQAKNQETPAAIIAFETKRIETRFEEAATLSKQHFEVMEKYLPLLNNKPIKPSALLFLRLKSPQKHLH